MNVIIVSSGNYSAPIPWNSSQVEDPPDSPLKNPALKLEDDPKILQGQGAATTLSLADAASLASLPGVQNVSASVHENLRVTAGSTVWLPAVRGEQATLPDIRRAWTFPHGRFFTAAEDSQAAQVAVLGSVAAAGLFGSRNPVGETITIHGQNFRVIGVVASSSWMVPASPGDGQFDAVYLPLSTMQRLLGRSYLDNITVSTASTGDVAHLVKVIYNHMRDLHHLSKTTASDFAVVSQAELGIAKGSRSDLSRAIMSNLTHLDSVTLTQLTKTLESTARTLSYLLGAIASVSLIVGGIGIMNMMLLSVTERIREIGIRRAVGARSGEVMQQFLLEAIMLSVGGGLLGIMLGIAASLMIERTLRWTTELSWTAIALSFTISAVIGILFGYYPARQASLVDPMTALRYE
jgi:ABC-type antimicrobial peptide transport system permease subunit